MSAYVIFTMNPDYPAPGEAPYRKVAVYEGRTAIDALTRFAADNGIEIGDGPASGKHWLSGRKALISFGNGQYHADLTTLPANVLVAS